MTGNWSMPAGSVDRWPEDYERGRPGWPPAVLDVPGLASSATMLEVGAGTGKLTRLLVPRFERVLAVEPAEEMRRLLVAFCPEAEILIGSAEQVPHENECALRAEHAGEFGEGARVVELVERLGGEDGIDGGVCERELRPTRSGSSSDRAGCSRPRSARGRARAGTPPPPRSTAPSDRPAHGDPIDPDVWLWRRHPGWRLEPERALAPH